LEDLEIKVASEDIKTIMEGGGLFLFGKTGTGKTLYASSLLLEVIRKHKLEDHSTITGQYTGGSEFFQEIRETMNNPEISSSDVLQKYEEADILILDEIGTEKLSDWVFQMLYLLINYRYEYLKPTIIVNNFGLKQLRQQLQDERIPSRIAGMCKVKHFEGRDYRIQENTNG
jgi:DNA replication protein DnaC